MKRIKAILSVLLAFALLFAMTACGNDKVKTETPEQTTTNDTKEVYAQAVKAISEAEQTSEENDHRFFTDDLSQYEYNTLTGDEYKAWNAALDEVWGCLGSVLSDDEMAALKTEQETWVGERDQKMKDAGKEVEGGSMQPMLEMSTGSQETMVRCYELASKLGPEFTYELIKSYGFENGESRLGYMIQENSAVDEGDYFTATVDLYRPVKIPADLQEGDVYYFKTDLEDEQTESVTADGDVLVGEDGAEYRYAPKQSDEEWVEIFCDSDDRVDMHFYTGEIQISKDAVHSIPIINEERAITLDALNTGLYFNGACFTDGILTKLISYGD